LKLDVKEKWTPKLAHSKRMLQKLNVGIIEGSGHTAVSQHKPAAMDGRIHIQQIVDKHQTH